MSTNINILKALTRETEPLSTGDIVIIVIGSLILLGVLVYFGFYIHRIHKLRYVSTHSSNGKHSKKEKELV